MGINECPFHLAFWSAEAAGDVVAGPLVITAPVGACGGSAERQKRAAREHGPRTAGRLTCRCVYFWGLTLVGLVRATDGRGTSALQLVLTRGDEGGRRRAAAALASAPTSVCRNDTSSPDGAMHHRPFEKTKDFFFSGRGGGAEGQRRAASEHGPRTAERLTCRCVYFCGMTFVGLVRATDGR